ncbi:ATP-binding protein [Rosistilla oblonga]|uniref:ATP-binding protein n=1 Tax=Rosistilla oblonga TaxID=2527990 RepID=UPI003A96C13F
MKVKDLQIDGFGVWTGLSVDSLPDGMTLFYGPNEAGKTTLMQFLRAMLYGFTSERRERYLPPVYGGSPGGALRVTGPGGGYELRRRAQLTDADGNGSLTVTGTDGLVQGEHRLKMLLGQIDEPIFKNVFAIGLRELQELGTLDDTSAADELYKLSSGLDRVSLVDVTRQLRDARSRVLGSESSNRSGQQLADLISRRDRLREEVDQLTRRGRRWAELATQRRTQIQEIEHLRVKLGQWEHDARVTEVGSTARETWVKRQELRDQIERTERGLDLPEDAPMQLVHIEAQVEERKAKLEEVKRQRRELRDKAAALPLSQRLLALQSRIEAASQQATWIEALRDQIAKLDKQVEKAEQQLDADAHRLGLTDEERKSLIEGFKSEMPDLSRATLATLGGPARTVKEFLFQAKQARDESLKDRQEIQVQEKQLREKIGHLQSDDLHESIKLQGAVIARFRKAIQTEEHLDKLRRHYKELENEAINLTTAEALPVDRSIFMAAPFLFGGVGLIYGLVKTTGIWNVAERDPTFGMFSMLIGMACLAMWYMGRQLFDRGTSSDLHDTERQIEVVRKQIRETEREHEETQKDLPAGSGPLESRLREALAELQAQEDALPLYHANQALVQRYKAARKRAEEAVEGLKRARADWKRTLLKLGLSESLSPKSIREMSDGYETLQASRRRVDELRDEKAERKRELAALGKRVESLYREALGEEEPENALASATQQDFKDPIQAVKDFINDEDEAEDYRPSRRGNDSRRQSDSGRSSEPRVSRRIPSDPLEQLNQMIQELERQQHWIKKRRELKEHDAQFRKASASHARAIERYEQNRRSLWAQCGVATQEQFYALVDRKTSLLEMRQNLEATQTKLDSLIGTKIDSGEVIRLLEETKAEDLDRRWESLNQKIEQTKERIGGLQTRQGELTAEMKQLTEDRRLTEAQLELGCIELQIRKCIEQWQTLGMTSKLLDEVCATFEKERQPETLREASSFLKQLTDGKYLRIWTPLGTNRLNVDNRDGKALPIEVLSRGTREAVFIALRLALAAAYARRGVMLPLVLDDVLVNFDRRRAVHAVRTLQHFAELGHQVMMFTCHEHIVEIFHEVAAEVRLLPPQGTPGVATVLLPEPPEEIVEEVVEEIVEEEPEEEPVAEVAEVVEETVEEETWEEPDVEEVAEEEPVEEELLEEVIEEIISETPEPEPEPEPEIIDEIEEEVEEFYEEPEPVIVTKVERHRRRPTPVIEDDLEPVDLNWVWFDTDPLPQDDDESDDEHSGPRNAWEHEDAWWAGKPAGVGQADDEDLR